MVQPIHMEVLKAKVLCFRMVELKEVLQKLNLSRQGNKPELSKRLLDFLADGSRIAAHGRTPASEQKLELAAKMIDLAYDNMARNALVSRAHQITVQQRVKEAEQRGTAGQSGGNGSVTAAAGGAAGAAAAAPAAEAAASGHVSKRPRVEQAEKDGSATAAAGGGGGSSRVQQASGLGLNRSSSAAYEPVSEVIDAFLNGAEGLGPLNTRVRCICAYTRQQEPLLQCEGAFCGVWQHALCVQQRLNTTSLAKVPMDVQPIVMGLKQRHQFFCERCRVARADPFWELFDPTILPSAVPRRTELQKTVQTPTQPPTVHMLPLFSTGSKSIVLNKQQLMLLRAKPNEYKLQALCLQLDDDVLFRFQWPVAATITCHTPSGMRLGTFPSICRRGPMAKMGPNQRDDPFDLSQLVLARDSHAGVLQMSIDFEHCDAAHTYVLMVCLMRRRTKEQVKALMKPPERLAAAVQRVRQQMHSCSSGSSSSTRPAAAASSSAAAANGPTAAAAANGVDDDVIDVEDDDDVVIGNSVVSLKDPNSGTRIVEAARFADTSGVVPSAFDLETFLDLAQRTRKWMDPHSSRPSCVQNLQIDAYLTHIIKALAALPEVTEVEINPEAQWRPAGSSAPFMSVLDHEHDVAAAAAAAASAAAAPAAAAGRDGCNGGSAAAAAADDDGDSDDDIDEAAEMEELRQAAAKLAQDRVQREAAAKAVEVVDLSALDSDEEEPAQPPPPQQQQQQQQQSGSGATGDQQQQQQQQGRVIQLPQRVVPPPVQVHQLQHPQQQQHQHQQPYGATHGSSNRAAASTAAAAVGPAVAHPAGAGMQHQQGGHGAAGSSQPHVQGTLTTAAGGSGDFTHLAQQPSGPYQVQHQQQHQQMPQQPQYHQQQQHQQMLQQPQYQQQHQHQQIQQQPQYQQQQHQQIQQQPRYQQQQQQPSSFGVQVSAMPLGSMAMQVSGAMQSGPGNIPAVTQYLQLQNMQGYQQQQPQHNMQQQFGAYMYQPAGALPAHGQQVVQRQVSMVQQGGLQGQQASSPVMQVTWSSNQQPPQLAGPSGLGPVGGSSYPIMQGHQPPPPQQQYEPAIVQQPSVAYQQQQQVPPPQYQQQVPPVYNGSTTMQVPMYQQPPQGYAGGATAGALDDDLFLFEHHIEHSF